LTNSIGMKLKLIQPGTLLMGSEMGDGDEKPVHQVTISKPFYLGVCPVTQAEHEQAVGSSPSFFQGANRPVDSVSWNDAQEFCRKLSQKEGVQYRLPTEGEWEYACRAGSTTEYCFGDDEERLGDYAWCGGNSGSETHEVGQKKPNAWGLCDMHGNVWEWCQDWLGDYPEGPQTDPTGPASAQCRLLRGGSWGYDAYLCRCAYRFSDAPDSDVLDYGVRVARSLP
jgi:formylglycine-generating enzyme required for sulfatase activity